MYKHLKEEQVKVIKEEFLKSLYEHHVDPNNPYIDISWDEVDDFVEWINTFWLTLLDSHLGRAMEEVVEEIETMEAEEPSNYPTPEGQEAVYGVLGRLKERIMSLTPPKGE